MKFFEQLQMRIRNHGAPATLVLTALMAGTFFAHWLIDPRSWPPLSLVTARLPSDLWTLASYPLGPASGGILGVLFGAMWLFGMGGIVERDTGSGRMLVSTLIFTIASGLSTWLGSLIVGLPSTLSGFWLILAAVTVAWGTRYPTNTAMFMFFIPIQARWLAWISVALAFLGTGPALAPFAAAPLGLVYLFASERLPFAYSARIGARRKEPTKTRSGLFVTEEFLDDVRKREKDREDRERLRKLFESNMIDNEPDEPKSR